MLATAAVAMTAVLGACLDFVDPEIPHAGTPPTLQVWIVLEAEQSAQIQASLVPGFDNVGISRGVPDETLRVMGRSLQPVERREDGTLVYQASHPITGSDALGPVTVVPPPVPGTTAPDPLAWVGIRRVGPDTLSVSTNADLALELDVADGAAAPIQQWFLQLQGAGPIIRVSSDGPPPDRLVIPALWVPEPADDGAVRATLTYVQSAATAGPAGNYVLTATLQIRLAWTVLITEGP